MTNKRSAPLQYQQVVILCDGLVAKGRLPSEITVREVWRLLGNGSLTTISKFIDRWFASIGPTAVSQPQGLATLPVVAVASVPAPPVATDYHADEICRLQAEIDALTASRSEQKGKNVRLVISLHTQICSLKKELETARADSAASEATLEEKLRKADIRWENSNKRGQQTQDRLLEMEAKYSVVCEVLVGLAEQLTPPRWFNRNPAFRAAKQFADKLKLEFSDEQ